MGRYALALTKAIVRRGSEHDFFYLLNGRLLPGSEPLLRELDQLLGRPLLYEGPVLGSDRLARPARERIADLMRNDRVETLSPDVYHVWSLFEGDAIFGEAVPWLTLPRVPVTSVTTYDLIPALFPDAYLGDVVSRASFNRALAVAQRFDLHLTISDATKRDVEQIVRLDPARVITMSGDVDPFFRVLAPHERRRGVIWSLLGERAFLLYVGGPDFRKNILGILEAFAPIAASLTERHDLVLVLDLDGDATARLQARAAELGIADRVIVTGFVDDSTLRELYNACSLFLFPSIYEGLGMPVIEAMRCGAPVLVGDNSSLVEIVPDPALRFNAGDAGAIAAAMRRALADPAVLARMRAYSAKRAAAFGWDRSADIALASWSETVAQTQAVPQTTRRPRFAMFTPLPGEKTGIADYSADFVPSLARHADMELFVDDVLALDLDAVAVPVRHHVEFTARASRYDAVVYQLGNSPYHYYMLPYMRRHPGVVVLHDAYIGHLGHDPADSLPFVQAIIDEEGGAARDLVEGCGDAFSAARALIERFPCCASFADGSLGVIVHSGFARSVVRSVANSCTGVDIAVLQQYRAGVAMGLRIEKAVARERLGLDPAVEIVGSFGHVASTKGILELIEAFTACNAARRGALLVFVGELEGGPTAATLYAQTILTTIAGREAIRITGFVDQASYDLWLRAIDVAVQLRTVSRGETSGAMLNLLTNATPFIYNRMGAAAEFPPAVALGLDAYDAETVSRALDTLLDDAAARQGYARAAADYAREVLDADAIAARFVETVVGMAERARACGPAPLARAIAAILASEPETGGLADEIAAAFVMQERSEAPPRLLIEVGLGPDHDSEAAGVPRRAYRSPDRSLRAQAFTLGPEGAVFADAVARSRGWALPVETVKSGALALRPFDRVLLPSGVLAVGVALRPFAHEIRSLGGTLVAVIDDIGPADRPALYPSRAADAARESLDCLLKYADGLVCASPGTARRLSAYVAAGDKPVRHGLRVAVVPRDGDTARDSPAPIDGRFCVFGAPMRDGEGHTLVLDAFERHWRDGGEVRLVVLVGARWDLCEFADRYAAHAEYGRRLHALPRDEKALAELHADAIAAIFIADNDASKDALQEALAVATPVLCSDALDVMELVADRRVRCFRSDDTEALASAIEELGSDATVTRRILPPGLSRADRIIDLARGRGWPAGEGI